MLPLRVTKARNRQAAQVPSWLRQVRSLLYALESSTTRDSSSMCVLLLSNVF
jgi:hypothetical protein